MMLKALYDYGKTHPDVRTFPGCSQRTLKYIVELDAAGNFVDIRRSDVGSVICPDVGSAARGTGVISNVLMEKASISLSLDSGVSGKALDRLNGKRKCFVDYFRDGVSQVPEFAAVLHMYDDDVIFNQVCDAAVQRGVKPGDAVGFSVDGNLLSDLDTVRSWWADYLSQDDFEPDVPKMLDIVTGEICTPARLFRPMPMQAAGGGQSAGVSLISFNCPSFESYGMKGAQCRNAPMAQETADIIADAITYLCSRAPRVGGVKFVHWYDCDLPSGQDVLDFGLFDIDESDDGDENSSINPAAMDALADKLVQSPVLGECPVDLSGRVYHILLMQPELSRMVVRRYMTGNYSELYHNFKSWFDDLSLVSANGTGLMRPCKLNKLLYSLLTKSEMAASSDKFAPLSPLIGPVFQACIAGNIIPDAIAVRALNANQSRIYKDDSVSPMVVQWLKLWLCRKLKSKGVEVDIMPELSNIKNMAYQCGRLMAIYEKIQAVVSPDVNVGVLTKFYSACSQSPALVLGNMQALSVHHFDKMKSRGYENLLSAALESAWGCIDGDIPASLSLEDKAYFALGYWHQRAELNKQIAAMKAAWAAKQEDKNTSESDSDMI